MQLLNPADTGKLPLETLCVRSRVWRSRLRGETATGGEEPGRSLSWMLTRLEPLARRRLDPYLKVQAVRWLCLPLRYRLASEPIPRGLQSIPLVDPRLSHLVRNARDAETLIRSLEDGLVSSEPWVRGLGARFRSGGPGGVEEHLCAGILHAGLATDGWEPVSLLLRRLAFIRLVLSVLRFWRWGVSTPPDFGAVPHEQRRGWLRVWNQRDSAGLERLIYQETGERLSIESPRQVERELLGGITRMLRRFGEDPLGLGVLLEYVWHLQLALTRRMLSVPGLIEPERLRQEGGVP